MENKTLFFPQNIYDNSLSAIYDQKFTQREIDVMACRMFGHSLKEIAKILNISSYRTPETHMRSVTKKVGGSSPEYLRDYVIRYGHYSDFKVYYVSLRVRFEFEKALAAMSNKIKITDTKYWVQQSEEQTNSPLHLQLIRDLSFLGFSIASETRDNSITVLTNSEPEQQSDAANFFSFEERDYYEIFFDFLKDQSPTHEIEVVRTNFEESKKQIILDIETRFPNEAYSALRSLFKSPLKDSWKKIFKNNTKWVSAFSLSVLVSLGAVIFFLKDSSSPIIARSNLNIPTESVFLNRSHLLEEMNAKLAKQKEIQSIILIGGGGSGKTTLARQYARSQNSPIVWEIDAESHDKLLDSFESLAGILAKSEQEKRDLKEILFIKDPQKKAEGILFFTVMKLRKNPGWILIFDNVDSFSDIQNHFPSDPKLWGTGMAILTSRDAHLQQNNQIKAALMIGELSPQQKLDLFMKIMKPDEGNSYRNPSVDETKQFLETLPSFPLDITVAAYYLKTTQLSYPEYLNNLAESQPSFTTTQENVLKETTNYSKTRYQIITTSLKYLINSNKNFADLALFISLIDSQNIPKDMLIKYKNETIVDDFLYHLKKYSLITDELSLSSKNPAFSIHRSTQSIFLSFLTELQSLESNNQPLITLTRLLDEYIEEAVCRDDINKMKFVMKHYVSLLSHHKLLTHNERGSLETDLGYIYSSTGYFAQAKQILEKGLRNLNVDNRNIDNIARNLVCQGWINSLFNNYADAKELLEKSLTIYRHNAPSKRKERARALVYLGDIYRWLGNYEKAKGLLEESLTLYNETTSEAHTAMALSCLGHTYEESGQYDSAIEVLDQNLSFCKQHLTPDNTRQAWGLLHLGKTYGEVGCYSKAEELVNQSILILKKHFPKYHGFNAVVLIMLGKIRNEQGKLETAKDILELGLKTHKDFGGEWHTTYAWGLESLGDVNRKLGYYEKARQLLYESIVIFEKQGGKDHLKTALPLKNLALVYLQEGNIEKAEELMKKSLDIFQKNNHPGIYASLESLSDLYLKKASLLTNSSEEAYRNFKDQAHLYLKQAYDIAKANFPEDSAHFKRIRGKLKKFGS